MRKAILVILYIALIVAVFLGMAFYITGVSASEKLDGECSGQETVGRCADKCADPTWTLQGFDKETGAAICSAPPTGCPYAERIPVDSPKCVPPTPDYLENLTTPAPQEGLPAEQFTGK